MIKNKIILGYGQYGEILDIVDKINDILDYYILKYYHDIQHFGINAIVKIDFFPSKIRFYLK